MSTPRPAHAERIELLTVGPGQDLLSRFGHAMLCVFSARTPDGLCFNYGAVANAEGLARRVVFGDAGFVIRAERYAFMIDYYRQEHRTIYRQVLPLEADQAARLEADLWRDADTLGSYDYQPLSDNCTTRVRDRIDAATDGALRAAATSVELTYRGFVRDALSDRPALLAGVDLVLGADGDAPLSTWDAMASPDAVRRVVEDVFGAQPAVLYRGMPPLPRAGPWTGRTSFVLVGLLLFAMGVAASRTPTWAQVCLLGAAGTVLAGVALFATVVLARSHVVQLWPNWVVMVCPPTDALLPVVFIPRVTARLAPWIQRYAFTKVGMATAVGLLDATGVIAQPLLAVCALSILGSAGIAIGLRPRHTQPAPTVAVAPPLSARRGRMRRKHRGRPRRTR